jgi:hypothetical protein
MSRVKLARITGNDLYVATLEDVGFKPPGEYAEVVGPADCALGMEQPELSDAIRALLIMTGCVARFVGTYWKVERRVAITPLNAPIGKAIRVRTQTGVRVDAGYEEWRQELNRFVGGLGE